jgi:ribonucleoside-diphosphate reductase alpha chain
MSIFRTELAKTTFERKYRHDGCETWEDLSRVLVDQVCGKYLSKDEVKELTWAIATQRFIPGGRYLYYAGRPNKFFNNCYLLKSEEDSRGDWADLSWKAETCLMTGGGIGNDYSIYRPHGATIKRTGGTASGPIPKMFMINEIGRNVMQGGSRRSAIYASLNWKHGDIKEFLTVKDWDNQKVQGTEYSVGDLKRLDFNYNAPLDMTNISVNYDTEWLLKYMATGDVGEVFKKNVEMALLNGEPGFSFNFFDKEHETLRNACTEVTSSDDSDVCNLGSVNLSRIESISEMAMVCELGTKFLMCGTLEADLPYEKIAKVREKNRRLGLGLMGVHEWLIKRKLRYEVNDELHKWLSVYRGVSDDVSKKFSQALSISTPVANRAIAPTGELKAPLH